MAKTCKFIRTKDRDTGEISVYVPPTVLWKDKVQSRDEWLKCYFETNCTTTSKLDWSSLSKKHEVMFLIEDDDRIYEEKY